MSNKNIIEKDDDSIVYTAKYEEQKAVSFIWILPLIILCILAWVSYESYMKKGTNIAISFKNAEGLKEGVTTLEYKGLQLGKVTKISIDKDLKNVIVHILVKSDVAKYVVSESSRFWIKKPTISLTKISGLSTLVNGYKIEISPKFRTKEEFENGKEQFDFVGLDSKPNDEVENNGYYISLIAKDKHSVDVGTPVFYNKYQIGEIASSDFKFEKVFLSIYIYDKYNYLVNKSSKFILNDALKVNYGPSGLKLEVGSLYSAIVGGITVVTPKKDASKISKDESQVLYSSKDELQKKEYFHIKFKELNGIGEDTPIIYRGVTIGKITKFTLDTDYINTKAFVYEKYKYLLTHKTDFFVEEPKISLDGAKNLGNIIKGNFVSLIYRKGKESKSFESLSLKNSQKGISSLKYTLYAKDLHSITKKSKIYYKNIVIGHVLDYALSKSLKQVNIQISIEKKYQKLINNHTLFYDMSSKLVELKNLDLNVNYSGINPLLNGGISIVSIKEKDTLNKKKFKLFSSYKEIENLKRMHNKGKTINAYFNNDFKVKKDMAIVYKNQEIGFVKDVKFNENKSIAKLFIYTQYRKYINKTSRFYKSASLDINASLSGIVFKIDSFASLLEGSIILQRNSNMIYDKYQIFSSEDKMKNSSNSITLIFDEVEGLQEESSALTYKGVKVGKVIKISLDSKQKVIVKVQIFKDYDSFAKEGSVFYLKKPIISLEEVANIGSAVMAVNIGVIKGKSKKYKKRFNALDSLALLDKSYNGSIFKVKSFHASSASVNSPIYYKNVQIGKINKIDLSKDASNVIMHCLIYDKYTKFIRKNSVFYDISGFNMKFSLFSGTKVESNTFTSILKGGFVVVTPYEYNEKASAKDSFKLVQELREDWQDISPSIK